LFKGGKKWAKIFLTLTFLDMLHWKST
jgi:hypothetical protein